MTQNTLAKTLTQFDGGRKLLFAKNQNINAFQEGVPTKNLNSKLDDDDQEDV